MLSASHALGQHSHNTPARLDWREFGFKTTPVDQRGCGSCYAYSIAESIQGQIFKQTGMLIPLSAQQLVDCSTAAGNRGCEGGSLRNTLRYLERSQGLMAKSLYPYKAEVCISYGFSTCRARATRYSVGTSRIKWFSSRARLALDCRAESYETFRLLPSSNA